MGERNKSSSMEHCSEAYGQLRERKAQLISFRRWITGKGRGCPASLYVGFKISPLRSHLESIFQPGMSWNNYGSEWCVAHIVPLRLFDLRNANHQALAWSSWNLLPMFMDDNDRKELCLDMSLSLIDALPVNEITVELRSIVAPHLLLLSQYRETLIRKYK